AGGTWGDVRCPDDGTGRRAPWLMGDVGMLVHERVPGANVLWSQGVGRVHPRPRTVGDRIRLVERGDVGRNDRWQGAQQVGDETFAVSEDVQPSDERQETRGRTLTEPAH